jgi:hypothetical protein
MPWVVRAQIALFVPVAQFVIGGALSALLLNVLMATGLRSTAMHVAISVLGLLVGATGAVAIAHRLWVASRAASAAVLALSSTAGFLVGTFLVHTLVSTDALKRDELVEAVIIGSCAVSMTVLGTFWPARSHSGPPLAVSE